ncbi:(d)CMP kinase [Lachnospiraceae bacterium oral taxon 096]|jgi:cytidylate kinase|nr:(d)CMP kinase [Lachnospiraceae bacterium]MBS4937448.1 (d)CMP kinase [Lachnospiraceae bacterium]PTL28869.1 (d)CMP kinase [Lachnospiraceae bacterium oral taxon 096]QUI95765.1 (d)CMP kinase [Lachnospiraceae bacterium oral taxon 096]RKW33681.1 MAG: (d)CMP kinase [Lachnoanaerobaculum sp.]
MLNKRLNIAIDGPAGAGKSTIAKMVSKKLNCIYVDTGAMYRAVALFFIKNGIASDDEKRIAKEIENIQVDIQFEAGDQKVLLNGKDVTEEIRAERVGNWASEISKYTLVREYLVKMQREVATKQDVVMDGRDIGTVVLPQANVKIYLTASSKVRAMRRYNELTQKGVFCDIHDIEQGIMERDAQDMNREISPLRQAKDAILIDSSNMTIDEVVEKIVSLARER